MKRLKQLLQLVGTKLISSPRNIRRIILILIDALILFFSFAISYKFLINAKIGIEVNDNYLVLIFYSFLGIIVYLLSDQYKRISSYFISTTFYNICKRNIILIIIIYFYQLIFTENKNNFYALILFWLIASFATTFFRFILKDWILLLKSSPNKPKINVVIYGAGSAGMQLYASLTHSNEYKVKYFVDDDPLLNKRLIGDLRIQSYKYLQSNHEDVDLVLLAMPSLGKNKLKEIILKIQNVNLSALKVPSLEKLNSGNKDISRLESISIDDLIGREKVVPNKKLLSKTIHNKVICIIGSGGSIGSELCRQIISLNPNKLILFERNEMSLYKIDKEISSLVKENNLKIDLISLLGCATNKNLLKKIFEKYYVSTVFNTAAYKHVPIVENNLIAGLSNNIISTQSICEACLDCGVERLVHISSDKAVRPTNVMGASKRVSELIVKSYVNNERNTKTIFSMVRFGNVLGSSGSVVPLFESQINQGGPITITHPEITRYFMTAEEAAQLVIQSSALSKGGEIFLLNMGDPIKIKDLAHQMIKLKGLSVKDNNSEKGEIQIIYTGIRPGEKLYEELLSDGISSPTEHPLIFQSEESLEEKNLASDLELLKEGLQNFNKSKVVIALKKLVPDWKSEKYSI